MRTGAWISALIAALAAAGLWAMWPLGRATSKNADSGEHASDVSSGRDLRVGVARRYQLSLQTQVEVGGSEVTRIDMTARWTLTLLEHDRTRSRWHGSMTDLGLTIPTSSGSERQRVDDIRRGLGAGHFFTLSRVGQLQAIRFADSMPAMAEQILKSLMAELQFRPGAAGEDVWQAKEADTTGEYRAEYRRLGPDRFSKSKIEYTRLFASAPSALGFSLPRPVLESSLHSYTFGEGNRLQALTVNEKIRSAAVGALPEIVSVTRLSLKLAEELRSSAVATLLAVDAKSREARLDEPATPEAIRHDTDQARIAGLTLPQALAALRGSAPDDKKSQARAYTALAAILRRDTSALEDAAARVRRGDESARTLIDALGDAGTPEAQSMLGGFARDAALDPELRRAALISLSFVTEATEETFATFEELFDDRALGKQARYGTGATVYQVRESNPALAKEVLGRLMQARPAGNSEQELVIYLDALGNSGHPDALSVVVSYVDHGVGAVRAAAVYALRRMPGAIPDKYLSRSMLNDASPAVRRRAAQAAGVRSPSWPLVSALSKMLTTESEFHARHAAVLVAIKWAPIAPAMADVLKWTSASDPDERLRRMAAGALVKLGQPS